MNPPEKRPVLSDVWDLDNRISGAAELRAIPPIHLSRNFSNSGSRPQAVAAWPTTRSIAAFLIPKHRGILGTNAEPIAAQCSTQKRSTFGSRNSPETAAMRLVTFPTLQRKNASSGNAARMFPRPAGAVLSNQRIPQENSRAVPVVPE